MEEKMAKGAYLTPDIKHLIGDIYLENRSLGPTKTREELLKRMKEKGLDKNFGPDYPSVSSVSLQLKKYKENDDERTPESKGLDKPWTFASLAEYPIAPEAIPIVISIYDKCWYETCLIGCDMEDWLLTVREALWIGRLHKIIELYKPRHVLPDVRDAIIDIIFNATNEEREMLNELKAKNKATNHELASLFGLKGKEIPIEDIVLEWASTYSDYEELSEIEGEPFDSSELDNNMVGDVYEYWGDRRDGIIEKIAEKHGIDENILRENSTLSMGDILRIAVSHSSRTQHRDKRIQDRDERILAEYFERYYGKEVKKTGGQK
jgi:hypothetical protein